MANITELQLQGDSTVHKLNDARITTTAVDTATHILTTNSGVTSIAPITAANLASVLGVVNYFRTVTDANDIIMQRGFYLADFGDPSLVSNLPQENAGWGVLLSVCAMNQALQIVSDHFNRLWIRTADTNNNIKEWVKII